MATIDDLVTRIDKLVRVMERSEGGGETARRLRRRPDDGTNYAAQAEAAEQLAESYRKINSSRAKQFEVEQQIEAVVNRTLDLQRKIKEAREGGASNEELKNLMDQLGAMEEQEDLIRKSKQSADDLSDSFSSIFSGKAPDLKGMLDPKNIQNLAKQYKSASMTMSAAQMASKMAVAALIAYTKAIVDLVVELDESETSFMRATGANRDFARSITNSYQETRKFGASAKETADAAQELFGLFTDFTMASEETRENLIETSTVLAKMGVSNSDFAKSIQISTKALGMSADQAAQNMLNLEKFAENLGVAPQQLAADFANAGDMVSKLGDQGTKAFKDLQVVMKVTGMSMDSILAITNKFDTFEGAAEMAGKLNAAIGGNFVNAMDLMMAESPAERFGMIRDAIMDTGLSFDDMSYYQKQFYADSMGLKDVNELALMMSGNIDLMSGAVEQSQQSMVDAAQRARDLETIQQKLQTAFAQLIPIITPLIDAFSEMAGFVADNIDVIKPLLGLLVILGSVLIAVGSGGTLTAGSIAGLTLGFGLMFDSVETGGESLTMLGAIFKGFIAPFAAFGRLLGYIYDKFMSMTESIRQNEEKMKMLGEVAEMLGYIIGVVLIGVALNLAAPFIGMAAVIGIVTTAVLGLATMFWETAFNPPNFLQGLIQIGEAFVNIAKSAMEILNPFNAVERAIRGIGETFSSILGGVTSFFTAITDPTGAENIARIAKAISEVKPVPAAAFTAAMTATAGAQTASAVGAAVTGATEMVNNMVFGGGGQSGKKQEITVNLMLDRQKLATVVREINGKAAVDAIAERS